MYLLDIKSSPSLTGQDNNRNMSSIRLDLLTKTTWKLKTPGGILVFRVLVQVWGRGDKILIKKKVNNLPGSFWTHFLEACIAICLPQGWKE